METRTKKKIKSTALLILVAFIWGFAFVGQRAGNEYVDPFFFIGARMLLGALTLSIPVFIKWRKARSRLGDEYKRLSAKEYLSENRLVIKAGFLCGIVLFIAMGTQQVALVYTTASKAGFLTTLYIVIVPIIGLFLKKPSHWNSWVGVVIAAVGLYFLTVTDSFYIATGDLILIVGAFFWAVHIFVIDRYAPHVDVVKMSMIQFIVVSVLGFVSLIFTGDFFIANMTIDSIIDALPSLMWAGVLSSGLGFTLQALAQKDASPTAVAIILSLESVFGLIGGVLLLNEVVTFKESIGCVLMFGAVILSQIPVKRNK